MSSVTIPPSVYENLPENREFVLLRVLGPYLFRYRVVLTLILFALVVDAIVSTVVPLATGYAIDHAVAGKDSAALGWILLTCVCALIVSAFAAVGRDWLYARLGAHVRRDLQHDLFVHIQSSPVGVFQHLSKGDLLSRFSSDVATLDATVCRGIPSILVCFLVAVVNLGCMFFVDVSLALIACVGLLATLALPLPMFGSVARFGLVHREADARVLAAVQGELDVRNLVCAYEFGETRIGRFDRVLESANRASVRFSFANNLVGRVPVLAALFLQLGLFAGGAYRAVEGFITAGALTSFLLLLNTAMTALSAVFDALPGVLASNAGASRIASVLAVASSTSLDSSSEFEVERLHRSIDLVDVAVEYGAQFRLAPITLSLPHGTSLGIVGPSGAGKTTILMLLARLVEPTTGAVCFDGVDVRSIPTAAVRRDVAMVFASELVFRGTVFENIAGGATRSESFETVRLVADAVGLSPLIAAAGLSMDSNIAETGEVSLGVRKRIALARALFRGPRLLLLDDAFSEVPLPEQRAVWKALRGGARRTDARCSGRQSRARRLVRECCVRRGGDGRRLRTSLGLDVALCELRFIYPSGEVQRGARLRLREVWTMTVPSRSRSTRKRSESHSPSSRASGTFGPVVCLEDQLVGEWWTTLFDANYLMTDAHVVENRENTVAETDLFLAASRPSETSRILDLCCGQARHVIELAQRGFGSVCGVDQSEYLLRLGRKRAHEAGVRVSLRRADVRRVPLASGSVDVVTILGNSFGYFPHVEADHDVLREVWRVLAPNGMLYIDASDGDVVREEFRPRSWDWLARNHAVMRQRELSRDGRRIVCREIIVHPRRGIIVDQIYAETLYSRQDFARMLEAAGFEQVSVVETTAWASDGGLDLGMMAGRLVMTARKPPGAPVFDSKARR